MAPHRKAPALAIAALAIALGIETCGLAEGAVDEVHELVYVGLGSQLFLALAAFAGALYLSPLPPARRLGLGPGRLPARQIALLAAGTVGLSHGVDGLLQATGLREQSVLAEVDAVLAGARGGTLLLALLALGIAPGVGEELLFRGLLQRGLEPQLGAVRAIALASVCFGALHFELVHAAAATALGLYLGTVAWLAGSVRAAIVCHAVNNLVAVGAAAAGGVTLPAVASVPLGFAVALATLWSVIRRRHLPPAAIGGFPPD